MIKNTINNRRGSLAGTSWYFTDCSYETQMSQMNSYWKYNENIILINFFIMLQLNS